MTDGWVTCPVCKRNRRLLRVEPDTAATALPVFCRDCKTEIILNIERGQSVERRSP
nr:cysteine-rich KTR domain-containing protein [uncultured Oscillibacter sp.]